MIDLDIELELNHLIYIFLTSLTWLGLAIWGRFWFNANYTTIPNLISVFITLSIWIGGIGVGIGLILVLWTIFE